MHWYFSHLHNLHVLHKFVWYCYELLTATMITVRPATFLVCASFVFMWIQKHWCVESIAYLLPIMVAVLGIYWMLCVWPYVILPKLWMFSVLLNFCIFQRNHAVSKGSILLNMPYSASTGYSIASMFRDCRRFKWFSSRNVTFWNLGECAQGLCGAKTLQKNRTALHFSMQL